LTGNRNDDVYRAMIFREATSADIRQIQIVRNAVRENKLSDPSGVTDKDCGEYLNVRGKGWVCEIEGTIVGFAIADLYDDNIWALFVSPEHERRGIGKKLQEIMLDWYFKQGKSKVWLSTDPGTRAEKFYRSSGWKEAGTHGKEIRFEMSSLEWGQFMQT
jgi:GNAT superfamily N-acetyltransferase